MRYCVHEVRWASQPCRILMERTLSLMNRQLIVGEGLGCYREVCPGCDAPLVWMAAACSMGLWGTWDMVPSVYVSMEGLCCTYKFSLRSKVLMCIF